MVVVGHDRRGGAERSLSVATLFVSILTWLRS
jgi:hypothetical protein